MLSHQQCEIARKTTGVILSDTDIISEFDALSLEEKEKIAKDLSDIIEKDDLAIYNISAKYFISQPVLFCVFKEWQSKNK